jgi:hypothetical protein
MIARANAEIETAARTRARWIAIAHLARSRRLSLSTDKANVVRSRSSAIERASRNKFYSNRRACFQHHLGASASRLSQRRMQPPDKFRSLFPSDTAHAQVTNPSAIHTPVPLSLVCPRAVDLVRNLLRESVCARRSVANGAICLPCRGYSDKRVTLVQSPGKAILRIIRHAMSR